MKEIILNVSKFKNESDIHRYLKEQLNFPEYYGNNLDALYDVLTEINEKVTFRLKTENSSKLLQCIITVLYDAVAENSNLTIISDDVSIHNSYNGNGGLSH
ncbi:barstar family protein [Velocimicrobium porci]|uniref:Barstar family protein n=1 Tax=Velocimicrobium porci TaxID=2606634 RepID=A0A6L5XY41_9FIRM|nr:barstar family protein [Velocimicrobium porci]MSS63529.1 barstar family protein [Velocimicrobium porci]